MRSRRRSHNTPLALAGLGALAVLASISGGASNATPVGAAGHTAPVTDPQGIRSVDFADVAQPGSACSNGLRFTPPGQIPVSGGQSQILDLGQLTQLVVDPAVAYGDVDRDGADDAVVHVTCSYGANGADDTVSVWSLEGDRVVQRASLDEPPEALGDGLPPTVQGISASDGRVTVTWSQYGDDDPRCCPSQQARVNYELDGDELAVVGDPVTSAVQP